MAKKKSRAKSKKSTPRSQRSAPLAPPSPKLLARLEDVDKLTKRRSVVKAEIVNACAQGVSDSIGRMKAASSRGRLLPG